MDFVALNDNMANITHQHTEHVEDLRASSKEKFRKNEFDHMLKSESTNLRAVATRQG